ncbi:MAG: CPBP family intramembrane metalloprotease [Eggerthellaceae bacterium]|nr:CPBP family intramembrane metalloprotease [Eggerthellaceae bacterium]
MNENTEKEIETLEDARVLRVPPIVRPILSWVLIAGLVAGFVSLAGRLMCGSALAELATGDTLFLLLRLLVSCGVTAAFEEMAFRGALLGVLLYRLERFSRAPFVASLIAAIIFALFHVYPELGLLVDEPGLALPAALKFAQATLFGFCMAAIVIETKSLVAVVGAHWLFDIFYFWPTYLYDGYFPAGYVVGDWVNLLVLGVSVLLFLPATIAAWRLPSQGMVGFSR